MNEFACNLWQGVPWILPLAWSELVGAEGACAPRGIAAKYASPRREIDLPMVQHEILTQLISTFRFCSIESTYDKPFSETPEIFDLAFQTLRILANN